VVAFSLRREGLPNFRSKEMTELCARLKERPRTVVLLTHRHSLRGLRQALPPELRVTETTHFGLAAPRWLPAGAGRAVVRGLGETALGLWDLAGVGGRRPGRRLRPRGARGAARGSEEAA